MEELVKERRKTNLTSFIENSATLFESNTFYRSPSTAWQASNDRYTFEFDSVPKVVFEQIDLRCLAKNDSSVIYATSGVYFPTQDRFEGHGGRMARLVSIQGARLLSERPATPNRQCPSTPAFLRA